MCLFSWDDIIKNNIDPKGCRHDPLLFFFFFLVFSAFPCPYVTSFPLVISAQICWGCQREEVECSSIAAGGESSVPTTCHKGLCSPLLSSPLFHICWMIWLIFFLSPFAMSILGQETSFTLCTKFTNFCPLSTWLLCSENDDIPNGSFVSRWQGSPGRRGPQGEQGEPGPKVSPAGFVCFRMCRRMMLECRIFS